MTKTLQKLKQYWPLILLTIFFSLFYLVFVNLFNSDIGRHIANGRELFVNSFSNSKEILTTNYYSYSQTDFANINHHWFFGVVAYLIHQIGGFKLLTWINLLLNVSAFVFILLTALNSVGKKSKLNIAIITVVAFLVMPLITNREEIRPESFSLLFLALYYYLFNTKLILKQKWLVGLVLSMQIFWVNTHLFFIFGPLLVGYFLFEESLTLLIKKKNVIKDKTVRFWVLLCSGLFLVSLINPHGISGLLAPLNIFDNYSYRVAENQSTFFLVDYGAHVNLNTFIIVSSFFVLIVGLVSLFNKKIELGKRISQLLLLIIFTALANKISRMTPFLGVFMIPYLSSEISKFTNVFWQKYKHKFDSSIFTMIASSLIFVVLIIVLKLGIFTPPVKNIGVGEVPNSYAAAEFIIQNDIKGPLFNNYDIGGYLAFTLFPQEKLFIDNRPEAYSGEFLNDEFLAALKDEDIWQKIVEKYNFNFIFFYRHDQIDGGQKFLFNRVIDEKWIPVYVDDFTLIFVKNSEKHQDIIKKFELPQEMFGMKSTQ